ncbi:hypothetical protein ACE4Z8_07775 [Enterococcus avium]|uniref:hypothetical protein n=1 Tax=Enterococcus TaxID=1350 RepID=UPI0022DEB874|nr:MULTISPECIES: hypothetical protein [Enterococcus]
MRHFGKIPYFIGHEPGPTPKKGQHCGYCSSLTEKQKRKLDSCPECGKSLFAFRKRKFR